ncbi:hypothetical protein [Rothia dentocariosa]|uniref:hypothetical protein n=1 Tax=Rothia dentocariosa TaxID=2047 RepID=UPI00204136C8|nr:hypothetical protein [Rothia dentocariosa]MCM3437868.1 hypothetical protein [Rothia dentocariosa]
MKIEVEVVRNHYPVGQGFFSSQQILYGDKKFTCVYDCGSVSKGHDDLLDKYMNDLKENTDTIDLLFISHFDKDHLNGIKSLADKFRIKKVIIPYLDPFEKLSVFISQRISFNTSMNIQNNRNFLNYVIDSRDNIFSRSDSEVIIAESELKGIQIGVVDSSLITSMNLGNSRNFNGKEPFWEFAYFSLIPGIGFEQCLSDKFKRLLGAELRKYIENNDVESIYDNWSAISDVYKSAVGDVSESEVDKNDACNSSSLILYSGPPKDSYSYRSYGPYCYYGPYDYVAPARRSSFCLGWLGTGDARLKEPTNVDVLKINLDWRKEYIHTVTVPHHGSKNNWSKEFIELFGKDGSGVYCITAADPVYTYKHPHNCVVRDIIRHHSLFYLVSTKPSSFYKEKIKIHLPLYYAPIANFKMSFDKDYYYL